MTAKIKDEVWNEIVKHVSGGLRERDAYEVEGISKQSYYVKIKKDIDYFDRIKKARIKFKQSLINDIKKDKAWTAKAWLLERIFKEEFSLKVEDRDERDYETIDFEYTEYQKN